MNHVFTFPDEHVTSNQRLMLYMNNMMSLLSLLLLQGLLSILGCPCDDQTLCYPLKRFPEKEVFGFMIKDTNWEKYNWTELTTLATFYRYNDSESFKLVCHAHANNVRVVPHIGSDILKYHDEKSQDTYIHGLIEDIEKYSLDGMNIDLESPIAKNSSDYHLLNTMVQKLYKAFKARNSSYQVTIDVAWSADCIDGRCYDYAELAKWSDYLFVMAYDERSQMFDGPPCYARSNSALQLNEHGIDSYRKLGIPANKLILGLPWYGYDYACISVDNHNRCVISSVPYLGVPCSDAAGSQHDYAAIIRDLLPLSKDGLQYNETDQSPYFFYESKSGDVHQVWFDNPKSLSVKYKFAKEHGLRGVGFWNTDAVYSDGSSPKHEGDDMWNAVEKFLH